MINLINVPNKIKKDSLLNILKITENSLERIYKQSLYWTIVCDNREIFNRIDENMRNIKFEENKSLKFEITLFKDIISKISKKINHQSYLKEADTLKGSSNSALSVKDNGEIRKDSKNWKTSTNESSLSWRKQSDYSNNSKDE